MGHSTWLYHRAWGQFQLERCLEPLYVMVRILGLVLKGIKHLAREMTGQTHMLEGQCRTGYTWGGALRGAKSKS